MRFSISSCILFFLVLVSVGGGAGSGLFAADASRIQKDLEFANVDGHSLKLDLYLPADKHPPLVVWIHGGGWRAGIKERCFVTWLTEHGYAVASISYRLTDKAIFPSQIHDCKAAVRWLRANADKYGYRSDRVAVAGSSAGGHLATLLGTSGGVEELEGTVGGHLDQSSRVDVIVDFYGPTDFVLRSKTHPARANLEESGTYGLLGGGADKQTERAKQASPTSYVSVDDPPLLIFHGDQDKKVLLDQSYRIQELYENSNLAVTLHVLEGLGHGGSAFFEGEQRRRMVAFLDQHLKALPRAAPESHGNLSSAIRAFVEAADEKFDPMHSFILVRHGWQSPKVDGAPKKPHVFW